jgi:hypothetical protein
MQSSFRPILMIEMSEAMPLKVERRVRKGGRRASISNFAVVCLARLRHTESRVNPPNELILLASKIFLDSGI